MRTAKHFLLAFSLLLIGRATGVAQTATAPAVVPATEDRPMRTLFGKGHKVHHGGWGSPTAAYTRIMDQDGLLLGLRGGWSIDRRLTIGLMANGLVTPVQNEWYDQMLMEEGTITRDASTLRMGYTGLLVEPVIGFASPVHISIPIIIGAGGVGYQSYTLQVDDLRPNTNREDGDSFFIVEPGIDVELNLVKMVKLCVGASYRYTSDIHLPQTDVDALHGVSASIAIKVGCF